MKQNKHTYGRIAAKTQQQARSAAPPGTYRPEFLRPRSFVPMSALDQARAESWHTHVRRATLADASFLAWAILTSSRGHLARGWFDIALNLSEAQCLEFLAQLAVTTARSRWHYSQFLLAESDTGPSAALSAFKAADVYVSSPVAIAQAAQALGISQQEQTSIWRRGAYLFNCTARPDDNCWTIESVVTVPGLRHRGLSSMLLRKALEEGRQRGLREAEITVVIGNDRAARIYEKADFRLACEMRHPEFEAATGAPGQRRYVRAL